MSHRVRGLWPRIALLVAAVELTALVPVIADEASNPAAPAAEASAGPADVASPRPLTPEEAALQAIDAEGQALVASLLAVGVADPSRMEEVQQQIQKVKRETRIRLLEAKADFARDRGDDQGLIEARKALEALLHPEPPVPVPNNRPLPDTKAQEVAK